MGTFTPMSNAAVSETAIAPHPELQGFYRGTENKRSFLRHIFDETATDYDRVERLLALGSGRWYRRQALVRSGLVAGMRVLDVATGTGLVAREAIGIVGLAGRVVGVDPSAGMIGQAHASLPGLAAVLGCGEALPLADGQFNFVSMGYALRHLPDLHVAFAEFARVLRPGGRLCVLEITRPHGVIRRQLLRTYFRVALPVAERVIHTSPATRRLWQYYWETIDQCVTPAVVLGALRDAGFARVEQRLSMGLFSEYTAMKPDSVG